MPAEKLFEFSIIPEPKQLKINPGGKKTIAFSVQNMSNRPVNAAAIINPLSSPRLDDREPLSPELWGRWLTIAEHGGNGQGINGRREVAFSENGVMNYTVDINLPQSLRAGRYSFRLMMLGIDDPDRELYDASQTVTFDVAPPPTQVNVRRYALIALILLVVLIAGIIAAAILLTPQPDARVILRAPAQVAQGETAEYTVSILNDNPFTLTNVVMNYKPPVGAAGVVAYVPDEGYRHCDEVEQQIYCGLGALGAQQEIMVVMEIIPRLGETVITNTNVLTVHSQSVEQGQRQSVVVPARIAGGQETTGIANGTGDIFMTVDPSAGTATVGEALTYRVTAWHTAEENRQLMLIYRLPRGLRYANTEWPAANEPLAVGRCRPATDNYFELMCNLGQTEANQPASIDLRVIPSEALPEDAANAFIVSAAPVEQTEETVPTADLDMVECQLLPTVGGAMAGNEQICLETGLAVVHSALFFDGIDDWVELADYTALPQSLTVEMWLNPFSSRNEQGIIGAHKPDGSNVFLVGFYNDGLDIRVDSVHHTLDFVSTERFHLAVVVDRVGSEESHVTVYINGLAQTSWMTETDRDRCTTCKVFADAIDSGVEIMPWSLGQDWDTGIPNPRRTDFFNGTMSDVRIWEGVRAQGEILETMQRRTIVLPNGNQENAGSANAMLIVDLPLVPPENINESDILIDWQDRDNNAVRYGPTWGEFGRHFGTALEFDGINDSLIANMQLTAPAGSDTYTISLSIASWIYLDSIPTEDQWIIGFAPLAAPIQETDPTFIVSGGEGGQSTIEAQVGEQLDVLDTLIRTTTRTIADTATLITSLTPAVETARITLANSLYDLIIALTESLGFDPYRIIDNFGLDVDVVGEDDLVAPRVPTIIPGQPLAFIPHTLPGETLLNVGEIQTIISALDPNFADITAVLTTTPPVQNALQNATQNREQSIQAQVTYSTLREELQAAAEPSNQDLARLAAANIRVQQANLVYVQSLVQLLASQPDPALLVPGFNAANLQAISSGLEALTSSRQAQPAYQALLSANTSFDTPANSPLDDSGLESVFTANRLAALRQWANATSTTGNQLPDAINDVETANDDLNEAQSTLQTTGEEHQALQAALEEAEGQQDILMNLINAQTAERTRRQELISARTLAIEALANAAPGDVPTAQNNLMLASAELEQHRIDSLSTLKGLIASSRNQEALLDDLGPILQVSLNSAYDAALDAVERQLLETITDKLLIEYLGGEESDLPPKSTQQVMFDAAKLAAQISLKNDTDGAVDTAQAELAAAIERRNKVQSLPLTADQRESLINFIREYLVAIDTDVAAAEQKLEQAVQDQQEANEDEQPLVTLDPILADILAEAVAAQVSQDLNDFLCTDEEFDFVLLNCPQPEPPPDEETEAQPEEIQTEGETEEETVSAISDSFTVLITNIQRITDPNVKQELAARESVMSRQLDLILRLTRFRIRWRLRLYAAFVQGQLAAELQEEIEDPAAEQLMASLQSTLVDLETSLRNLLRLEFMLIQPGDTLDSVTGQVVDQVERETQIQSLLASFEAAAGKSETILRVLLGELPGLPGDFFTDAGPLLPLVAFTSAPSSTLNEARERLTKSSPLLAKPAAQTGTATPTPIPGETATPQAAATPTPETSEATTVPQTSPTPAPETTPAATTTPEAEAAPTATPAAPGQEILLPPNVRLWFALIIDNDGHIALVARPNGSNTWTVFKEDIPVPTDRWVNYSGTLTYVVNPERSGVPEIKLYRDGAQSKQSNLQTNVGFSIGSCDARFSAGLYFAGLCDQYFFGGLLDEVRFWTRALSETEIDQWRTRPGESFDEMAYWSFDDGPGRARTAACGEDPLAAIAIGLTCDYSRNNFDIRVRGPRWIEADLQVGEFEE